MITLSNGHKIDVVAASGALGYDGNDAGHGLVRLWKLPYRVVGLLNPQNYTIVTKTLTAKPRVGNLKWWCPWRCVRSFRDGFINSVGLTNPGIEAWIEDYGLSLDPLRDNYRGYKLVVSIAPENQTEMEQMLEGINLLNIVGVELNLSCPNVQHADNTVQFYLDMVRTAAHHTHHPLILKLSWTDPMVQIMKATTGFVEVFDLINAVPLKAMVSEDLPSPLEKYGLVGAVSGPQIAHLARTALAVAIDNGVRKPIISGGGIYSFEEAVVRFKMGAGAVSFGTWFLKQPSGPDKATARLRAEGYAKQTAVVKVS